MSEVVQEAVKVLNEKMQGQSFSGTAKFEIEGEGSVIIDSDGAHAGDEDTDVTMTADADTFQGIIDGSTNPTSAFMTGKLKVDGDMGMAMKLASALA
ncbi:SCP2 sterol-binding domain-containing protein [uncultured Pseudosulfitobacter sp.]|jgi:putative sterol carrier protein|uniref:SCP2 sterol-binding domain-containing protein n=1 Tax=uncultured Pseudosulfitobacter sp. TaxID=2854214 RepID=UPI0030DCF1E2|tara:strand:- start:2199 stop:2489 length:291 start_codon:yes stop_codon:yes gene_type:complete